ncbi:HipA N-terminal domain-containing protein [Thioalkalivibrio sulfidiphilus]|uniref:HipA N-terminal domain-containing protein n=1 Tax=Thioalkalivibrio sulfidiphilus TaxID=1033854 RepID=UPI000182811A|nr:HipA N-terminal domain-containing protein [Thioalkalivibrio sulfidiphilus]
MTSVAEVKLWGSTIGAVALEDGDDVASFEYDPAFARSGIEIAPLTMPLVSCPVNILPFSVAVRACGKARLRRNGHPHFKQA